MEEAIELIVDIIESLHDMEIYRIVELEHRNIDINEDELLDDINTCIEKLEEFLKKASN